MEFFSTYMEPITNWIYHHPHWALLAAFLISFSESLAVVGSIIPGTVTMTAFGMLAGSGVMRIDLTLIAAILGAIAGDTASYAIGYVYSDSLVQIWPFKRYPKWLRYGKDYFERHGGKSVFIGRFTGPLRSLIPIIAGMMKMNRWHFLLANVTSAIGWSILYVMPGVLIGAASSELSSSSSSRLFIVVLCVLGIVWALTIGIKWLFIHVNQWLHYHLNQYWDRLLRSPYVGKYVRFFTPEGEQDHYPTASMLILLMIFIVLMPVFIYSYVYSQWALVVDEAAYQFCLSIRTYDFDSFFIISRLIISDLSIITFTIGVIIYALYHRDWRFLKFWISLIVTSAYLILLMTYVLPSPLPVYHFSSLSFLSYPTRGLTFATCLYGFLIFYMASFYQQTISVLFRIILLTGLLVAGIALVYLGEDWIMNVVLAYKIGFTNALLHWAIYRRKYRPHFRPYHPIILTIVLLIFATTVSTVFYFTPISNQQQSYIQQFDIQYNTWWQQKRPLLPLYSMNRFGKEIGLMNIQYVGPINTFIKTLEKAGWKKQPDSFFYSLLIRISQSSTSASPPLMAQLYMNKKPIFMMTQRGAKNSSDLIIRFWRSNYHVHDQNQTIWIGSIQTQSPIEQKQPSDLIHQLSRQLNDYSTKTVIINPKKTRPRSATSTILLLIHKQRP